jgi:hypothetical protein
MKRMTVLLALLLALVATGAAAQSLTGTVTGKVLDEQGAVLPGVTVTLTGRTGASPTVTDQRGEFRFVGVAPGTYDLKAELSGFAPRSETGIDVGIGRTITLSFTLRVGGMTETVEVVGSAATIDITSSASDNSLSSDLLQNMPINVGNFNAAAGLLNYSPGVNSGSGFGGEASYGNALLIDGVDVRDPEAGSAWVFFNYNIVEEVQVGGLGAPAEYGGFTGAVVNTITKSGGNKYSGLFEGRYTGKDLGGNNISSENLKLNPALGSSAKMTKLTDYTVQMGGPVRRDKVFWWFSAQRYAFDQDPVGPLKSRTEVSPRYNAKLTFQPTPNDTVTFSGQYDNYNVTGRLGLVSARSATDSQTLNQDSPEAVWNSQYRRVFGSSTFLEAKLTGYWGYYYLDPVDRTPYRYDGDTNGEAGGAGYYYQADRGRNQVNISLSQFSNFYGKHNFKFGAEFERSKSWSRFGYMPCTLPGIQGQVGCYFTDYSGVPYYASGYSYNFDGRNKRESLYAQDQWQVGRLTANLGLRLDRIRGYSPKDKKDVYTPELAIGPRLGVAFDVTGKGTTVAKAFFGRYFEGASFNPWQRAISGQDGAWGYYNDGTSWQEDYLIPALKYEICSGDPLPAGCENIKHLGLMEYNVALEHQLRRDMRVAVTLIRRDYDNFINSVGPKMRFSMATATLPSWTFDTADPMGSASRTVPVYKWDNRTASNKDFIIRNLDGWQYLGSNGQVIATANPWRQYNGIMAVLTKSYSHRWQSQLSYVWSTTEGNMSSSGASTGGATGGNATYENPSRWLVYGEGLLPLDRTHEVKVFAGYQIPFIEVNLNAYYRALSGTTYRGDISVARAILGTSGSVAIPVEERGARRHDMFHQIDLRAEKTFNIDVHRFGLYVDVQNLMNSDIITGRVTRYPSSSVSYFDNSNVQQSATLRFGTPTGIQGARQVTIGGRWSF